MNRRDAIKTALFGAVVAPMAAITMPVKPDVYLVCMTGKRVITCYSLEEALYVQFIEHLMHKRDNWNNPYIYPPSAIILPDGTVTSQLRGKIRWSNGNTSEMDL